MIGGCKLLVINSFFLGMNDAHFEFPCTCDNSTMFFYYGGSHRGFLFSRHDLSQFFWLLDSYMHFCSDRFINSRFSKSLTIWGFFYQQRPFFPECICACEALKFASLQAFCPSVLRSFPLRPFTPLRVTTWILNSHKAQAEQFVLHLKRSFFI